VQTPAIIGLSAQMNAFSHRHRSQGKTIGFVPTMGALHEGHLSLVKAANASCDVVIVSIFVNPSQFNDPKDFERYPRTVEKDVKLLGEIGCDVVFVPERVEEIYPETYVPFTIDLGNLANVMEGKHRPGHFNGVVNVVSRLFEITEPTHAFFGLKDYQQFLVVDKLIKTRQFPIELIGLPTSRTATGLARSSRNQLLNPIELHQALGLYNMLGKAREQFGKTDVELIKGQVNDFFNSHPEFELEYFELSQGTDLIPITGLGTEAEKPMAFVAARLGKIRLIDNIFLKD